MKFAPLNVPLERRLQTLGVCLLMCEVAIPLAFSWLLLVGLLWARFYWTVLLYGVWYIYDLHQDERGGRIWPAFKRQPVSGWARNYFPVKFVKTAELPPDRNYIVGYHPHGILCIAGFVNFVGDDGTFNRCFPGITPYILTLKLNFLVPFCREILLWFGACSSSKASVRYILNNMGTGKAVIIVVGGAQEALDAHPNKDYILTLKDRKGFVREALVNGADLVPAFNFGENDLFRQIENPPGSYLRTLQEFIKRYFGFSVPLFCGRGFFQYSWGVMPFRSQMMTVVGKPIRVERVAEPTQEQVDELHALYVKSLYELFEEHKHNCDHGKRNLIIA